MVRLRSTRFVSSFNLRLEAAQPAKGDRPRMKTNQSEHQTHQPKEEQDE
ncbi:hypothetical protein GTQ43_03825 [Nostoc sp. KVJ3]|nr:hypothetical protein [Nostoc sp. KVJ3]MCW5313007.1 hypothetical protein [Nostoc sp. KVJ3]